MLSLLILLALFGGWRAGRAVRATLHRLPRHNDAFVFF
jgi:hypothetical protein